MRPIGSKRVADNVGTTLFTVVAALIRYGGSAHCRTQCVTNQTPENGHSFRSVSLIPLNFNPKIKSFASAGGVNRLQDGSERLLNYDL